MQIEGFDAREARDFIMERLWQSGIYRDLNDETIQLAVEWGIRLDGEYMIRAGLIRADDGPINPQAYYDDDDAYEQILDAMLENNVLPTMDEMRVASLVNDFMDFHQKYLEDKGLLYWVDGE